MISPTPKISTAPERAFECVKHAKRLWLRDVAVGELVYTPPDFIRHRMQSREPMRGLADAMNAVGRYCIGAVCEFESRFNPRRVA